jgi:hypothetical protein
LLSGVTLSDWTTLLCDELSRQMGQRVGRQSAGNSWFRVDLGHHGLLVMDEDDTDVLLWLLDAEGRTNGPLWSSTMTPKTAAAAAAEVAKAIKESPDAATFNVWPPVARDTAREDALNALWARVQDRIDQVELPLRGEDHLGAAIDMVEQFIDELARSDAGVTAAEFVDPFKAEAAKAIRRKAMTAS